jgi:hypothetical protein
MPIVYLILGKNIKACNTRYATCSFCECFEMFVKLQSNSSSNLHSVAYASPITGTCFTASFLLCVLNLYNKTQARICNSVAYASPITGLAPH